MKIICLDYDGSYTEFPELFDMIIEKSQALGYRVIVATMRCESEEDAGLRTFYKKNISVFYTGRQAKLPWLLKFGIKPDLWIDDNPKWLFENG